MRPLDSAAAARKISSEVYGLSREEAAPRSSSFPKNSSSASPKWRVNAGSDNPAAYLIALVEVGADVIDDPEGDAIDLVRCRQGFGCGSRFDILYLVHTVPG